MKKVIALLLAAAMLMSLCACEKQDRFKETYTTIAQAYEKTNQISQDIYEAWRMGINEKDAINGKDESYTYSTHYDDSDLTALADELYLSREDLENAITHLMKKDTYDTGSTYNPGDWYTFSNVLFDSFFSACVTVVSTAYEINGTADEIRDLLEDSSEQLQTLSKNQGDNEHYPNLKEYFTNTIAFFEFCMNPEGSFEQVVETFNAYRNTGRECYYKLHYAFGDSLFPKKEEEDEEDDASTTTDEYESDNDTTTTTNAFFS